jgi:hypothetical protein
MCAESVDLPGASHVERLVVDTSIPPRDADDAGNVVVKGSLVDPPVEPWPYRAPPEPEPKSSGALEIELRPYHDWGNRGPATMRVWLPAEQPDTPSEGGS